MLHLIENNLSGAVILSRLRQGHAVRRTCWVKDYYIRICNERGYDEYGDAIFDERHDSIYTIGTAGYFMHLAWSSEPLADYEVYATGYQHFDEELDRYVQSFDVRHPRDGIAMLWADDWEDYGFVDSRRFDELTHQLQDSIRDAITAAKLAAIKEAERKWMDENDQV